MAFVFSGTQLFLATENSLNINDIRNGSFVSQIHFHHKSLLFHDIYIVNPTLIALIGSCGVIFVKV